MDIEIFDINQKDTQMIKEMTKRDFSLNEFKKRYGKNRTERLVSSIKESGIMREVKKVENPFGKGKKVSIYRVELPKVNGGSASLFLSKSKKFLRTKEGRSLKHGR